MKDPERFNIQEPWHDDTGVFGTRGSQPNPSCDAQGLFERFLEPYQHDAILFYYNFVSSFH